MSDLKEYLKNINTNTLKQLCLILNVEHKFGREVMIDNMDNVGCSVDEIKKILFTNQDNEYFVKCESGHYFYTNELSDQYFTPICMKCGQESETILCETNANF